MIGNDIVDLLAPGNVGKPADRRFIHRVFTEGEQELIANAAEPDRMLWSLWAAKEAVFKIEARLDLATIFAHRSFVVTPNDSALSRGRVQFRNRSYPVTWSQQTDLVHAWSVPDSNTAEPVNSKIALLVETSTGPESTAVRAMACRLLAGHGFPGCVITGRPPTVFRDGTTLPIGISLSHDGGWGAVAITIGQSLEGLPEPFQASMTANFI